MKYRKLLVLFSLFASNLVDQPAPEVTLEQGIVSGKISKDGTFFEYLGIPYATADKNTRFQAPGPPPTWKGVYKAVDEMNSCVQKAFIGTMGSEDCLKVNVNVPVTAKRPLPVMVYIHGGAFILGSGGKLLYAPDFLVQKDVIVVSFNYRLGILGFLCLGIKEAPGNAGLKDQVAALRWIKKNIAAFGGDPENITIFGESAGATSTSMLIISKATDGLFNKAILQSGSSLSNWAINREPLQSASLLAKTLGHDTDDPHELYKIFSEMEYSDLILLKATKTLGKFYDTQLMHLPCVEKNIEGVEATIDDLPFNLLHKNSKNIPIIIGTNSKEGLFLTALATDESLQERQGKYLFASDVSFASEKEGDAVAKKVKEFYFGKDDISMKNLMNVSDLYTHLYFEMPSIFETEILVMKNTAPIYNYYFNYSGNRNYLKMRTGNSKESGACHADDVFYLFDARVLIFPISERDRSMIESMTSMWTDFAKYGDPTPKFSSVPVKWMPSNKDKLNFLYIDDEFSMGPMPSPEAYQLWKYVYEHRKTK
ncbi:esterase FE4-like [Epargyreus clarus]|uniref:esterase FE4-like n=1 Tax=Epargyreus clarus TaxID=520877 RepID=UPI003C2BB67F